VEMGVNEVGQENAPAYGGWDEADGADGGHPLRQHESKHPTGHCSLVG